jgi:hypothetical protein
MKKIYILFYVFTLVAAMLFSACGFITISEVDLDNFPPEMQVDTTSVNFTELAINLTGDPERDFAGYMVDDLTGSMFPPSADIEKIYIAFSRKFLFIGHRTTDLGTDPYFDRGAFYIFIDNGMTNTDEFPRASKGVKRLDATGLNNAGISGSFRFLDDIGTRIPTEGPRKFSLYAKNYRTPYYSKGPDFVMYRFMDDSVSYELIRGATATVGWPYFLEDNVTEIAIPWDHIYPDMGPDKLPKYIYLAFHVNDAAAGKYFTTSEWAPAGQDTSGTADFITNWYQVQISE